MQDLLHTDFPESSLIGPSRSNVGIYVVLPEKTILNSQIIEEDWALSEIETDKLTQYYESQLKGFNVLGNKYQRKKYLKEGIAPQEIDFDKMPTPYPKQRAFMESEADITLFGGAAGGSKSWALLLDFCQPDLIMNPYYGAIIFRRTFPQVRNEGGLWDESGKIYGAMGATPNQSRLLWRFPTGATVRFGHLQHEKDIYAWQGSQLPRIGFDELTHFTETQFFYLLSRNRSPYGVPSKVKATTNPDAESWVMKFVSWYLDDDGIPDPKKAGKIRYFIRKDGELIWGNSVEEIAESLDLSVDAIANKVRSFCFLPASIEDNPVLLRNDPGYLANLESQHPVERARLLGGNWKVRFESGSIFNRNWFPITYSSFSTSVPSVRFWDFAATSKEISTSTSFYTVGVLVRRFDTKQNSYFIVDDVAIAQCGPGELDSFVRKKALHDGRQVSVRWELEGGAAAIHFQDILQNQLFGFDAQGIRPLGDKVTRSVNTARIAYSGRIFIRDSDWTEDFLTAVQNFDGTPKPKVNDIIDALNGAVSQLADDDTFVFHQLF